MYAPIACLAHYFATHAKLLAAHRELNSLSLYIYETSSAAAPGNETAMLLLTFNDGDCAPAREIERMCARGSQRRKLSQSKNAFVLFAHDLLTARIEQRR